uniref:Late embryogenesis abundant protein LEA-2 subgroup domain-containing protein n=1 Tax=Fagus sylvatica TaxID=28930 RepID=A0A2N9FPQ3_FAGSY
MLEKEQVRPLASATDRPRSDDDEAALHKQKLKRRRCIKCCGSIAALMLLQAIVVIILIFTVFRVKDPIIKMNGITITKLELINNNTTPKPGVNMSLTADVSVKNPNVASFKYSNTTTTLFYYGTVVGEARGPPGKAKPNKEDRRAMNEYHSRYYHGQASVQSQFASGCRFRVIDYEQLFKNTRKSQNVEYN